MVVSNFTQQFVDTPRAATYLAMQACTLEKWRTLGRGPLFQKFGRAVRYRLVDLDAFAAQQQFPSTAEAATKRALHAVHETMHQGA